ncbi:MAG: hypothetical protein ACI406_16965, partial [Victivallis vadensis]
GASPPGPQTGKVPAPGTVSSFLLRKNLKTGVIIHQFISSVGGTCLRRPGRVQKATRPSYRSLKKQKAE